MGAKSIKKIKLIALKETIEDLLVSEDGSEIFEQEPDSGEKAEQFSVDHVNGKEVSSIIKDLSEYDGEDQLIESSLKKKTARLTQDAMEEMAKELRNQLQEKINSYRSDVERNPDWSSRVNQITTGTKKLENEFKSRIQEISGFSNREDKLRGIQDLKTVSQKSREDIHKRFDKTLEPFQEMFRKETAKSTKNIINGIYEEVRNHLKILWLTFQKQNVTEKEKLLNLSKRFDLSGPLSELDDKKADDVLRKINYEIAHIKSFIDKKLLEVGDELSKGQANSLLSIYKGGIQRVINKYKDSINSEAWRNFIQSFQKRATRISNHHIKKSKWSGRLDLLKRSLKTYKEEIEDFVNVIGSYCFHMT